MKKRRKCCPTALKGETCTDTSCSKFHQYILCEPCDRVIDIKLLKDHTNGRKHLQQVASCRPPILQQHLPSRSATSKLRSTSDIDSWLSSVPVGSIPTTGASPLGTGSGEGGSLTKVPYCATTLQGEICIDSRCQYRHDIVRCEPCGRSFPASLPHQHQSGRPHLGRVASNSSPNPRASQQPYLSQPSPPNSRLIIPEIPSLESWDNLQSFIPDEDPHESVTVSHEDGLDFVVEAKGTIANPVFSPVSHTILVENTSSPSSLSVQSMELGSSQSPCFSAYLLDKTVLLQLNLQREVLVTFNPPHPGTFHTTLKLTSSDEMRPNDQEFSVTRELRGHAILSGGETSSGEPSNEVDRDTMREEGTGITVSHEFGLRFSVERSRFDEPFAPQTEGLVITKASVKPLVSFKAARIQSPEHVVDTFSARLEGNSTWITHNRKNTVGVCFQPQQEGLYEAVLELTLWDHNSGRDFVVKRTLSGCAVQLTGGQREEETESEKDIGSQPISDHADDCTRVSVYGGEELLGSDGTGISVSHARGLDFGIVERKRPNGPFATPSSLLTIKHANGFPAVTLVKERTRTLDGSDLEFEAVFEGDSVNIRPGTQSTVRIIFSPKFEGVFNATLELVFYHSQLSAWFAVRRTLQGIAGSLEDHKHLESLGQGNEDEPVKSGEEVLPLKRILLPTDQGHCYLPNYEVPAIIQEAVDISTVTCPYDEHAPDLVAALRPDGLVMSGTYIHYFEGLLCIEDGHRQWDVLCRPPYSVNVHENGQRYAVEIENDDEDLLPEVALGDYLWLDDVQNNIRYEASATDIEVIIRRRLAVLKLSLRLPPEFNLFPGPQFVLRFRHNRITLRRQYHALTTSFPPPRRLLFPSVSDIKPNRNLPGTEIYNLKFRHLVNRRIRDDPQQLQAVVSTLVQPKGSVPFIVYGPPGTGKTCTVVESIVQLVRCDATVRVLACTPSYTAADYLFERLAAAGLDSDKLYRLTASFPHEDDASEVVRTFSQITRHERLLAFRVVVSTCPEAGVLRNLNVPVGHFSHIIIDDAAQAEEPLAMIPIMAFSNLDTRIILAGDPNQLGPDIKSPTAARSGLGKSYFERLMFMSDVYGPDTQVGKTIVRLWRNWRSHGAIIAWSNRYLYEDSMRDYGNAYITYHLVHSDVLPKKGFPIVFHGVKGSEQHAESSPSPFDVLEASIVRNYCAKLVENTEQKIYPEEIGVLAPYKSQIRTIRQLLKVAKLSDVSVRSVEQFQGQERKVIVLVTTRGNEESHPRRSLGVLVNRQRMNLAITRAQALPIVIGDPEVLGKYEHWGSFLRYIKSRKGWTGKVHDWKSEEVIPPPGYGIAPRKGGVVYGEKIIGGKSERVDRISESSEVIG